MPPKWPIPMLLVVLSLISSTSAVRGANFDPSETKTEDPESNQTPSDVQVIEPTDTHNEDLSSQTGESDGALDKASHIATLVSAGIQANLAQIQSFEVELNVKEKRNISVRGESFQQDRTIKRRISHEGSKWRQDIETTGIHFDTKGKVPYETSSISDGKRTTMYDSVGQVVTISPGREMVFQPTKDLNYGYSFFGNSLQQELPNISEFHYVQGSPGIELLQLTIRSSEGVLDVFVNPKRGFMVERAEATDPQGRIVGTLRTRGFKQIPAGGWLPLGIVEEVYTYDDGARVPVGSTDAQATVISVNQPINPSKFKLIIPPGTLVRDMAAGIETRSEFDPQRLTENSHGIRLWILAVMNGILAALLVVLILHKKRKLVAQ